MNITRRWIAEHLGETLLQRGDEYVQHGHVHRMDVLDQGRGVQGHVEDRDGSMQSVFVETDDAGIEGDCSCSTGYNCEHVAAMLLAMLNAQQPLHSKAHAKPAQPAVQPKVSMDYPDDVPQRILYILHPEPQSCHVSVDVVLARRLSDGSYYKLVPYLLRNFFNHVLHRFVLPVDVAIIQHIGHPDLTHNTFLPTGSSGAALITQMLDTGRCHWLDADTPALTSGDERRGAWFWHTDAQASQQLLLAVDGSEHMPDINSASLLIPATPPFYVDNKAMQCGSIVTDCPEHLYEHLLFLHALRPNEGLPLENLSCDWPTAVPTPETIHARHADIAPQAVLQLISNDTQAHLNGVRLLFDYGGHVIHTDDDTDTVIYYQQEGEWLTTRRHDDAEQGFIRYLREMGMHPQYSLYGQSEDILPDWTLPTGTDWPEFLVSRLETLHQQGFRIESIPGFRYDIVQVRQWNVDCAEHGAMGEVHFEVVLEDGSHLDLIDVIADWLQQEPQRLSDTALYKLSRQNMQYLPIPDGRILPVAADLLHGILTSMLDQFNNRITARQSNIAAMDWLQLRVKLKDSPYIHVRDQSSWVERMRQLADMREIPAVTPPAGLGAILRDYQQEGLNWLQCLHQLGIGALLADDMGLGKTIQALAHILKEKETGSLQAPALVVAPTSLMHNWKLEASRFAPELRVLTWHGSGRKQSLDNIKDHDLVLTTYGLMVRDAQLLQAHAWSLLILDEAQHIRNPRTHAARTVRELDVTQRICLTGTPMENHLGELWALFDFIMPGYLCDGRTFTRIFRNPIERESSDMRQQQLNLRIRPFMLRRTKEEVAAELPAKTTMIQSVDMGEAQRELYEGIRLMMHRKVHDAMQTMGKGQSHIIMLEALLKMRQVCCDPRLLKTSLMNNKDSSIHQNITIESIDKAESAKLEWLRDMLPEMLDEGRRILLFSQFTSMLKLIAQVCDDMAIPYLSLTGSSRNRGDIVEAFQRQQVPLFLISLKAGGAGLNLTAADTVIHYDPWWNPATEAQASDRAHRIGQDKPVFIYKLIAENSVESRILDMQARKQQLASALYDGAKQTSMMWSEEDMLALFAPLDE